ncbi:MAG: exosome complex exonuclease Rrp41 [Candidatus Diapherotrites archaeon]|nr:exosome complex exonuclease Rrp41 [Candidatus Diapherotrites archaeon]
MAGKGNENVTYVDKSGKRLDGRKVDELRPIKVDVGVLDRADGSAYVEWGHNKAIAAVYGPREVLPKHMANPYKAIMRVYYRMAPFSVPEHKRPAPGRREIEISKVLSEALDAAVLTERFPQSQIEVHIDILDADAGTRITALTAASAALADAGIPMRDLVAGVSVGKAGGRVIADLTKAEEDASDAVDIPMAILPSTKEVVLLQMDGILTKEEWKDAHELAHKAAEKVYNLQKEALRKRYESAEAVEETEEIAETKEEVVE